MRLCEQPEYEVRSPAAEWPCRDSSSVRRAIPSLPPHGAGNLPARDQRHTVMELSTRRAGATALLLILLFASCGERAKLWIARRFGRLVGDPPGFASRRKALRACVRHRPQANDRGGTAAEPCPLGADCGEPSEAPFSLWWGGVRPGSGHMDGNCRRARPDRVRNGRCRRRPPLSLDHRRRIDAPGGAACFCVIRPW